MSHSHLIYGMALIVSGATASTRAADQPVSFRNDVMAVLSKAGCNQGTCHGNATGKGGLMLSLRGDDPAADFVRLSHGDHGRRANRFEPDRSLLLLKPTMQVPHVGGRRLEKGTDAYSILRQWIEAGLPFDEVDSSTLSSISVSPESATVSSDANPIQIRVVATFSDGSTRDVTSMAVYEPSEPSVDVTADGLVTPMMGSRLTETTIGVRYLGQQRPVRVAFLPAHQDFVWSPPVQSGPVSPIDRFVDDKLRRLRINPSAVCDDATFVRRASLDLVGMIPTAAEAREFVDSDRPNKRAELIDDLLQRQEFADWWTLKWADLLRNEEKALDRKGVANFQAWIRTAINNEMPMNEFAQTILASRGSTYASPAANYFRAMRDPFMRAESAAQVFLGIRLQCAKCHNHPFDRWTQDDYYGWASVFARVDYKILENNRRDRNDKHEFKGEQVVYQRPEGLVEDPRTGRPVDPRLLAGLTRTGPVESGSSQALRPSEPRSRENGHPADRSNLAGDPLLALADWVADRRNRQFARVQVNRIWAELLGRGLVDPVDDFRATNPASHPELLEWLTDDFIGHRYDLRHTIRTICRTQTYQRTAEPTAGNSADEQNLSHTIVRRLSAEQLLDSFSRAVSVPLQFTGYPVGLRAAQLPGAYDVHSRYGDPSLASDFLVLFGKPPRLQACSCERSGDTTLAQSFQLISGRLLHQLLTADGNRLDKILQSGQTDSAAVEQLYWSILSRAPTAEERSALEVRLSDSTDRRRTLEDVAWALLNSGEFLLRR